MSSLNRVTIIGRLGQEPSVRFTKSNTAVANLSVATSERYKDKSGEWNETTEWHRCVAWGRTAEICQEYLQKGSLVYIEGPLQTKKWEDKEGRERHTTEIKVLKMQMLDSKDGKKPQRGEQPKPNNDSVDMSGVDGSEDLPF